MSENTKGRKFPIWGFAIALIFFVVAMCIWGWSQRNSSEGSFTMINAIFSGLAFVGLTIAVFMQREELELQRNELKATRAEFAQQNKTLKHQRFENSFFQMLEVHNQKASSFKYRVETGAKAFSQMYEQIKGHMDSHKNKGSAEAVLQAYKAVTSEHDALEYIPYINNLLNLVSLIESTDLVGTTDKPFYFQILACQLSNIELNLICLESEIKDIKKYLLEVGFFKDLKHPILPVIGTTSMSFH